MDFNMGIRLDKHTTQNERDVLETLGIKEIASRNTALTGAQSNSQCILDAKSFEEHRSFCVVCLSSRCPC